MNYSPDTTNPEKLVGTKLYGNRGMVYTLGRVIKQGGEGITYEVVGSPDKIIKLYRSNKLTAEDFREREAKISVMLRQPPQAQSNRPFVAWPTDILRMNGIFAGFVMPRASAVGNLKCATRAEEIPTHFPGYTWRYGIIIARNLATAVGLVHNSGAVIGDLNHNNILVDSHGYITLIDTDSFTITDRNSGTVYKTKVALPEIVAPELQGLNWSLETSIFTKESDLFSLAIHIFALLCNNGHPFSCIWTGNASSSEGCADRQVRNIVTGRCAYVSKPHPYTRPMKNVPNMAMFPPYIRELFDRAFTYNEVNAKSSAVIRNRPSAVEWLDALNRLMKEPTHTCNKYAVHIYPAFYGRCPWCENGIRPGTVTPTPSPTPKPSPAFTPSPAPSFTPAPAKKPKRNAMLLLLPAIVFGACGGCSSKISASSDIQTVSMLIGALIGLLVARLMKNQYQKAPTTLRALGRVVTVCFISAFIAALIVELLSII